MDKNTNEKQFNRVMKTVEDVIAGQDCLKAIRIIKKELSLKRNASDDIQHYLLSQLVQSFLNHKDYHSAFEWGTNTYALYPSCTTTARNTVLAARTIIWDDPQSELFAQQEKICLEVIAKSAVELAGDPCYYAPVVKIGQGEINDCTYFLGEMYFRRWEKTNSSKDRETGKNYLQRYLEIRNRNSGMSVKAARELLRDLDKRNDTYISDLMDSIDQLTDNNKYKEAIAFCKKQLKKKANSSDKDVIHILYNKMAYCANYLDNDQLAFESARKALELQPICLNTICELIVSGVALSSRKFDSKSAEETEKHCHLVLRKGSKVLQKDPCKSKVSLGFTKRVINDCRYVLGYLTLKRWQADFKDSADLKAAMKYIKLYIKDRDRKSRFYLAGAKDVLSFAEVELRNVQKGL